MINKKTIKAYALKNAVEHSGKANSNSVLNSLFHVGLKKSNIKKTILIIQEVIKEVNKLDKQEQKKQLSKFEKQISHRKEREGLPLLPGAKKGKVITRMPPSPSGPLTLGHILTIGPNFLYVKKYGGKFYIRIEDTNPENIYKPAYKMIKEESKWLTNGKAKIIIQSERMNLYYKYAEKLIKKQAAYVCTCSAEKFREYVAEKKDCPCRKNNVEQNIEKWRAMLKDLKPGEAVVRFKSDMKHKNPAFRDFPLARINLTPHPLQGKKYRVWPLMNLSVTTDDIEMGITHMIRGKDHRDNAERQKMIFKVFGKKYPWNAYIGRLHFKDIEISASKMRQGIESGKYKGWDDPRLPTAASLKKQGYKPESFWKFVEQRGISEVDKIISKEDFFEVLDRFNK